MSSFVDLSRAVKIDKENKKSRSYRLDGRTVFIKDYSFEELICEEIAKFSGVETVHYKIGMYNGEKVLYSECFYNEGETFIPGSHILSEYCEHLSELNPGEYIGYYSSNNLTVIWEALRHKFGKEHVKDIEKIMNALVKMFCFDLLINMSDRHDDNWGVIVSPDNIRLAPAFDNETHFLWDKNLLRLDSNNLDTNTEMLDKFLGISSSEFCNVFYEMFDKLTVEMVDTIIMVKIISERGIPFDEKTIIKFSKDYRKYRSELETIVEKYRGGE